MKIFQQLSVRFQQNPQFLLESNNDYVEALLKMPNQVLILVIPF